MFRVLFTFIFLCASAFSLAELNRIHLDKNNEELIIYYDIPNSIGIEINERYKSILIKDKTNTGSDKGKFKVVLRIKSIISEDFYDPIRVYSNGEFLLYKDFLFPQKIEYKDGVYTNYQGDISSDFYISESSSYIVGDRFVFWGRREALKILGLNDIFLEDKVAEVYHSVFDYYTSNFGGIKKEEPIVVIDFHDDGKEFYYKGDALSNFLSYNISNISSLNNKRYNELYEFIAHEVFHIWNSYEHNHYGEAWLHEGSAEYFSKRSLLELGYINDSMFRNIQEAYLNACVRYYKENNKKIMNTNNSDFSIYVCGNALHILLERLESKRMVMDVWNGLLKKENYHSDDFIKILKSLPGTKRETIDKVYDFIYMEGGVTRVIEGLDISSSEHVDD